MPIDPRIAMGVRPIQIESPINALAKAAELQGIQQHNALSQAKLDAHRAQAARSGQLNTLLQSGASPDELLRGGFMEEALTLREDARKGAKADQDLANDRLSGQEKAFKLKKDQAQYHLQLLGNVNDPAAAQQWYTSAVQSGLLGMQEAAAGMQKVPQDPQGFQQWKAGQEATGLTVAERMEQMWKDKTFRLNLRKQDHTEANDAQQIAISRGNLGVAQANVGLRRQELEHNRNQPKGVYDPARGVVVDPRTGQATPVMQDGKPIGPKEASAKPLPQAVLKQITEARDNATTIDRLAGSFKPEYAGKGVFGLGADMQLSASGNIGVDKDSVEWWKNYRKQAELIERHALFGAALTPTEQGSWRSADIAPGMHHDVVAKNLATRNELAKKVFENTQRDLIDAGHNEERIGAIAGRGARSPEAAGATVKVSSDADYDALPSGATFIGPDGKTRRKP